MSSKANLLNYLELKGVKKATFYKNTGLSNGFLDKNDNISSDKIEIIISVYSDIDLNWLITGNGEMLKVTGDRGLYIDEQNSEIITKEAQSCVGIPLIPIDAMAGFAIGTGDSVMTYDCDHYVIPNMLNADFLIQVKGQSMEPKYLSGDIVACKKLNLDTFFQWNKVYVLDTEQGAIIKRINKSESENCIKCVSVNEDYAPFDLPLESIYSLALVVGMIRVE